MKIPTNIEEFEYMEYICDQIIVVTKFENLIIYFKTKVVDGVLGWIFLWYFIDIHQLNLGQFRNLKFLDEIPLRKCVFWEFFTNECIIIFSFYKKPTTISKRRRFYKWALHYFFNFLLFVNVLWITNMRPYGRWKNVSYILYVHWFYSILFI